MKLNSRQPGQDRSIFSESEMVAFKQEAKRVNTKCTGGRAGLIIWYHFISGIYILWVPLIILYTILAAMVPGMILIAILLPLSYAFFKRAESYFADVI